MNEYSYELELLKLIKIHSVFKTYRLKKMYRKY